MMNYNFGTFIIHLNSKYNFIRTFVKQLNKSLMVIILKRNATAKDIKEALLKLGRNIFEKKSTRKKEIIASTFGKGLFGNDKTPMQIQKEMRDEWD